jgi:hypothetical protein
MTNESIKPCDYLRPPNSLRPSIQSEPQGSFPWIPKAAHAFLNHPLRLNMCPGDRRALVLSTAAAMALGLLAPATAAAAAETTIYGVDATYKRLRDRSFHALRQRLSAIREIAPFGIRSRNSDVPACAKAAAASISGRVSELTNVALHCSLGSPSRR